jgi:C-terminal processing protease CtpA/Prc
VLINGVSFSCADIFPEEMRHLAHATLIGDTTGGGGGAQQYYSLPSGTRMRLSTKGFRKYDLSEIEWNGIVPDYTVVQTTDDIKHGRDKQLEFAADYLRANGRRP